MTAPAVAAARFCGAAAVGAGLGLFYGFLRPLRQKSNWFADLIFMIATFFGWVYVGFGICGGDLRLVYLGGMALGGFLWECTAGRLLRPVFSFFWKWVARIFGGLLYPVRFFLKFMGKILKKLFAKWKKWVTIGWNIRRQQHHNTGGRRYGQQKKKTLSSGPGPHQSVGENPDPGSNSIVYHRYGGAAGQHRDQQKSV
jgi:hypothetical protein